MGVTPICLCYLQYFVEFPIIAIHKEHVHFVQTTTPPMSVDTMLVFSNLSSSLFCLLLAIHCFFRVHEKQCATNKAHFESKSLAYFVLGLLVDGPDIGEHHP